jgi:hypothetical protein
LSGGYDHRKVTGFNFRLGCAHLKSEIPNLKSEISVLP